MTEKTKNKKEMKQEKDLGKKYDGFAIASFVLGLFILLNYILIILSFIIMPENLIVFETLIFLFSTGLIIPISIAAIILGIVSLIRIKNNKNLKGKIFAILGIVMTSFFFLLYLAGSLIIGGL